MVIITEISVVLLLMLLVLSGCGSRREKADEATTGQSTADAQPSPDTDEVPLSLDALQGHWVDVNGDTTLDFTGNQMTVRWGSYEDLYTVGVTGTDRYGTVFNAKDRNLMFEMMSELIWRSGVLTAGEMVLDAEGHSYRFVREEALEGELAIVDDPWDMPKEITSDELAEFHLTFSLDDTRFDVPSDADWPAGRYSINVERGESGAYLLSFDISGESYIIKQYRSEVGEEFVKGLAQLIREQEIPEKNGYYRHNETSVHGWSLSAEYESGEELLLMAEGDAALECPFSIYRFLEYVEAERELGFRCRPFSESIRDTVTWLREEGFIDAGKSFGVKDKSGENRAALSTLKTATSGATNYPRGRLFVRFLLRFYRQSQGRFLLLSGSCRFAQHRRF